MNPSSQMPVTSATNSLPKQSLPLEPYALPDVISWWPLAPGWWLLLVLCLVSFSLLFFFARRHHRNHAYRRVTLKQYKILSNHYANAQEFCAQANSLLKQCALAAGYPVAGYAEKKWQQFLLQTPAAFEQQSLQQLTRSAYRAPNTAIKDENIDTLKQQCKVWIKKHRRYINNSASNTVNNIMSKQGLEENIHAKP